MNIKALEYFLTVAELRNFTRAAERHFISQTAISQQIAALESSFGVKLFKRSTKNVTLTEAGLCLKREAEELLSNYRRMCQAMQSFSEKNSALVIEYTGPIEQALIKKAMKCFPELGKGCKVDFRYNGQSAARADLKAGVCDAVISVAEEFAGDEEIAKVLLARNPIEVAMALDHPLARKNGPITVEELSGENFIILKPEVAQHGNAVVTKLLEQHLGIPESNIIPVDNIETQLLQISLGLGISLLPDTSEVRNYGVTFAPLAGKSMWHEVFFFYSRKTPVLAEIQKCLLMIDK